MKCQNCDMLMPDENNYCGNCGKPLEGSRIFFKDLVAAGEIKAGAKITCRHKSAIVEGIVQADGTLEVDGKIYNSPPEAIAVIRGVACDSWHCWKFFDPVDNRERPIHSIKVAFKRKQA